MIIGLNGYSSVGKDAVGAIIQYLNCPTIDVSIEEVCSNYQDYEELLDEESGWITRKFAGKLKDIASHLTGIDREKFEDQDFKKTYLGPEWDYWTVSVINKGNLFYQSGRFLTKEEADKHAIHLATNRGTSETEYVVELHRMTIRQFLQEIGTDALRTGLHPNVWVNALMADYTCVPADRAPNGWDCDNWIITDVRFKNEAKVIKEKGGIIIRIDRPGIAPINNHPSEVDLDDWNFDYKIFNNSDLYDLKLNVENILKHANLL